MLQQILQHNHGAFFLALHNSLSFAGVLRISFGTKRTNVIRRLQRTMKAGGL
jgi:hypothetical protein